MTWGSLLLKTTILGGGISVFGYYYSQDTRASIHMAIPRIFQLLFDPETSHDIAIRMGELGWLPRDNTSTDPSLSISLWGQSFSHPIGLAAGFDKNARCVDNLLEMGFSFVEAGTVTPLPQPGNPKPRLFRLVNDEAIINRYGFNSDGLDTMLVRLTNRYNQHRTSHEAVVPGFMGINLGKNKISESQESTIQDYVEGVRKLGIFADYLVINVSSPNTPQLRTLQSSQNLIPIIDAVKKARSDLSTQWKNTTLQLPPLLVKISPDLSEEQLIDTIKALESCKVDGIIVANTTISRSASLKSDPGIVLEQGGLSGSPLFDRSTKILKKVYNLTNGKIPLIASGGIMNAQDAYTKLRAGASLVQVYTGMIYRGAGIATEMKKQLAELIHRDGFQSISQVIGLDCQNKMQ